MQFTLTGLSREQYFKGNFIADKKEGRGGLKVLIESCEKFRELCYRDISFLRHLSSFLLSMLRKE